jgi:polygalacturonase
MQSRREFISTLAVGAAVFGAGSYLEAADPWSEVPRILSRIRPPVFPPRDFDVRKFGAAGDNKTDCTTAFANGIKACNQAGGGRVVVPGGEYATGPIHLLSNVNLYASTGATIRFNRDPNNYPNVFTRWEGVELMNYSPFIDAFEQENVAITGRGTIDGNSIASTGGRGKAEPNAAGKPEMSTRTRTATPCLKCRRKVFLSPHVSSGRGITCARCSSSRTAAKTF